MIVRLKCALDAATICPISTVSAAKSGGGINPDHPFNLTVLLLLLLVVVVPISSPFPFSSFHTFSTRGGSPLLTFPLSPTHFPPSSRRPPPPSNNGDRRDEGGEYHGGNYFGRVHLRLFIPHSYFNLQLIHWRTLLRSSCFMPCS